MKKSAMSKHSFSTAPVSVKLDPEVKRRLQKLGKIKRRSTHWLMKEAINSYLKHAESTEQLKQDTLSRWEEAVCGKTISHQVVTEWLDSWGTEEEIDPLC
jgi:predicted transcriptional regulator